MGDVYNDLDRYQQIAKELKVSVLVVVRRASHLNLISKEAYFNFYQERQHQEINQVRENSGGNFYATQNLRVGRRFADAIINDTREGNTLL